MSSELAGFRHVLRPGCGRTLLLLHGTGGDESNLIGLGQALDPEATLLSPRGKVLENGMPRFFRRFAEGVFDYEDVAFRAGELAGFVDTACREYELDARRVIAAGYSNGANIAAALLLLYPGVLAGAALFRAMVPIPDPRAGSRGAAPLIGAAPVFIANGRRDPIAPPEQAARLAALLRQDGAEVTMHWHAGGHELTTDDVEAAREWLAARSTA